jgi:hypothetical protein
MGPALKVCESEAIAILDFHQREQAQHLRLVRHGRGENAARAASLGAQAEPDQVLARGGRIALERLASVIEVIYLIFNVPFRVTKLSCRPELSDHIFSFS